MSKGNGRRNSNDKDNDMDKLSDTRNGLSSSTQDQVIYYASLSNPNFNKSRSENNNNSNNSNSTNKEFKSKLK